MVLVSYDQESVEDIVSMGFLQNLSLAQILNFFCQCLVECGRVGLD